MTQKPSEICNGCADDHDPGKCLWLGASHWGMCRGFYTRFEAVNEWSEGWVPGVASDSKREQR